MRLRPIALALLTIVGCTGSDSSDSTSVADGTFDSTAESTTNDPSTTGSPTGGTTEDGTTDSVGDSTDASGPADSSGGSSEGGTTAGGPTQVQFETTLGTIVFELDESAAPITSANFLAYVDSGFFDGTDGLGETIIHRVVPGFVIQGGGLTETLDSKATMPPIVNESGNGLTNVRGSISMARTSDPDSATSQFFVNLVDNPGLDEAPGYAVFGAVVEGIEVVDAIAEVQTSSQGPYDDVPVEPIIVTSATRL